MKPKYIEWCYRCGQPLLNSQTTPEGHECRPQVRWYDVHGIVHSLYLLLGDPYPRTFPRDDVHYALCVGEHAVERVKELEQQLAQVTKELADARYLLSRCKPDLDPPTMARKHD